MPVILPPEQFSVWLDPEFEGYDYLQSLLTPFDSEELTAYPVSRVVNSPKNDSPECVERLAE